MKTAKELCEERDQERLEQIIRRMKQSYDLSITVGKEFRYGKYYYNDTESDFITRNKEKLEELGYKVEKYEDEENVYYEKEIPGFFVSKKVKELTTTFKRVWYRISAEYNYYQYDLMKKYRE